MAEIAVGIDLGTSNTCVSLMRDGQVEVLPNAFGERTSASVVHFHEDGSVEVGNSAKAKVIHAKGEAEAAEKLAEAASVLSHQEQAIQLRYMQTLVEIAGDKSNTIVFPLDLIESLKKLQP